jgi:DNA-directed RNA polymerase subunit M/transcription elongation factor TFIIS
MRNLLLGPKGSQRVDERHCEKCGTSIDRDGKIHYKRHVEREMEEQAAAIAAAEAKEKNDD